MLKKLAPTPVWHYRSKVQAVAVNQPTNKNRVNLADLNRFASRLREFISLSNSPHGFAPGAANRAGLFNGLALELFALQYAHNPAYRRFCQARGASPAAIHDWEEVPAIPALAFKELELSALPPEHRTRVFHSSGTTGHRPSRHFHDSASLALYEASLWPWFVAHALPELPREGGGWGGQNAGGAVRARQHGRIPQTVVALAPRTSEAPHSSLAHMFEVIERQMPLRASAFLGKIGLDGGWTLDVERTVECLETCARNDRPALVLGTAFSFVHLLDHLGDLRTSLALPSGSRVLETGGYKGRSRSLSRPALHSLIRERLGISETFILCEYGMSELSSQGYDHVCGAPSVDESGSARTSSSRFVRCFQFPPWTRLQVISPETGREVGEGETGLVRVFDLANVYSVMAVQTEDLGVRRGSGFELLGRQAQAEPRGCSLMAV